MVFKIELDFRSGDLWALWNNWLVFDPGLWDILWTYHLMDISLLHEMHLFRAADAAAERKQAAFLGVTTGRWVSDSKRTIDAMAVLQWWVIRLDVLIMT